MMVTYTGKRFDPTCLSSDMIDIRDIAHALALQCRFGGHCQAFYSVAEHSVRVAQVLDATGFNATVVLQGLLHDASEAYLMDIPKPIKVHLPEYRDLERHVQSTIYQTFGLPADMPASVHWADMTMLVTESRDLMADRGRGWGIQATPLPDPVYPHTTAEAEAMFLAKFEFYTAFRNAGGADAR